MSWLNNLWLCTSRLGDSPFKTSWLVPGSVSRNFIRVVTSTVVLFAALPAKTQTEIEGPNVPQTDTVMTNQPSVADSFARGVGPQTAAAAPQAVVAATRAAPRQRYRMRGARARAKKIEASAAQSTPIVTENAQPLNAQPLTPMIQIWPGAQTLTGTDDITPGGVKTKSDMLASDPDEAIVHSNELSDIDLAANPPAQALAFASTDGRAPSETDEQAMPVNRFSAFAESVKSVAQAPWFDSVLLVLAGTIAAFFAARVFVKA